MSSNVKLNLPAFTAFRQSPHVIGAVNAEAERVAARANALGHNSHGRQTPSTGCCPAIPSNVGTIALVQAENHQAYVDNAAHNTLAKALGGGG